MAAVLVTQLTQGYGGPAQLVEVSAGTGGRAAPRAARRRSEAVLAGPLFPRRAPDRLRRHEPRGRWSARARDRAVRQQQLVSTWTRIAADHAWPDKPRWSPDGGTLYFLSRAAGGFYALWGVRIDRDRGAPAGPPFRVAQFDSPRFHVDSDMEHLRDGHRQGAVWSCRCGPSRAASGCMSNGGYSSTKGGDRAFSPISHLRGIEVIRRSAQVRRHVPHHFLPSAPAWPSACWRRHRLVGRPDRPEGTRGARSNAPWRCCRSAPTVPSG